MSEARYSIRTVGNATYVRRLDKPKVSLPVGKLCSPPWDEVKHLYAPLDRLKAAKKKQPAKKKKRRQ